MGESFTVRKSIITTVHPWISLASDALGDRIYAVAQYSSSLFVYNNKSDGFEPISLLPVDWNGTNRTWQCIDCDDSGKYIIASLTNSSLFVSRDFGNSFEAIIGLPVSDWVGAAVKSIEVAYAVAAGVGVFKSDDGEL